MPQSRSIESLLSEATPPAAKDEAVYQNQQVSESLYEIVPAPPPFVRSYTPGATLGHNHQFRASDSATARKSWRKPQQVHCALGAGGARASWAQHSTSAGSEKNNNALKTGGGRKSKPNTLPVLNCLFAALNNNDAGNGTNAEDDTPYMEIPANGYV